IYTLFRAFSRPDEAEQFRQDLEQGMGWGDAKQRLCERIEQDLAPMRDRYAALMAEPDRIEDILLAGAEKARKLALPVMEQLREAVGLSNPSRKKSVVSTGKKQDAAA